MRIVLIFTVVALALAGAAAPSPGTDLIAGIPQRGTQLGQATAPVTLLIYEDIACPHCRTFTIEALPTIVRDYVRPGLVKLDFRGVAAVSRASLPALRYALAAAKQNKLWHITQLYYERQSRLSTLVTDRAMRTLARQVKGLNADRLIADAKRPGIGLKITALQKEQVARDVPGTPWFFIRKGAGAPEVVRPDAYDGESFAALLDTALGR